MYSLLLAPGAGGSAEKLAPWAAAFTASADETGVRRLSRAQCIGKDGAAKVHGHVVALAAAHPDDGIIAAGFSKGGREVLAAARRCSGAERLAAIICLAFPLIAPDGDDRAGELVDSLAVPALFISGREDPYLTRQPGGARAGEARLAALVAAMRPGSRAVFLEGLGHDLGGGAQASRDAVAREVQSFLRELSRGIGDAGAADASGGGGAGRSGGARR